MATATKRGLPEEAVVRSVRKAHRRKIKLPSLAEQIIDADIELYRRSTLSAVSGEATPALENFAEVELLIDVLTATAVGLGNSGGFPIMVPFTLPGDRVRAKIYRIDHVLQVAYADFVRVIDPSPHRRDDLVRCKHFTRCSGCQLQMLAYGEQLEHKRRVIREAYRQHFDAGDSRVPDVLETRGSPLEYAYRTKITPHFDKSAAGARSQLSRDIGFNESGRRRVLDIEECPIATATVQTGLILERRRILDAWDDFKRGATLLLRESDADSGGLKCITRPKDIATVSFDGFKFQFPAGEFFQNNSAILPGLTSYVRDNIGDAKYLVDAYCGSGLFSVTCSSGCEAVAGVEISHESVSWARKNALLNGVKNAEFLVGEAEQLFKTITFPADETVIVIDPPRKGCDMAFIEQLMAFSPTRIIYVSCCVHTQARDLARIAEHSPNKYIIESIRGFDLFPQTHHVESVAVLKKSPIESGAP
ncbi:tRNA(m5U54)methyltransferase [Savitreella phatthalungensis]